MLYAFLRILSPLAVRAGIKVSGPNELPQKAAESNEEKKEREREIEAIRELCGHQKCRDVFELILGCGDKGASADFIQDMIWPNSAKSRRGDIQSYVCKMRKTMRENPECRHTISCKGGKYFLVRESGQAIN